MSPLPSEAWHYMNLFLLQVLDHSCWTGTFVILQVCGLALFFGALLEFCMSLGQLLLLLKHVAVFCPIYLKLSPLFCLLCYAAQLQLCSFSTCDLRKIQLTNTSSSMSISSLTELQWVTINNVSFLFVSFFIFCFGFYMQYSYFTYSRSQCSLDAMFKHKGERASQDSVKFRLCSLLLKVESFNLLQTL